MYLYVWRYDQNMISEVRIFAGKAGNLEMPIEAREALALRDGDQVEVVIRKKRVRADRTAEEIRIRGQRMAEFIRKTTRAM